MAAGVQSWSKKSLSPDEKDELAISLYQGILGLHKKLNSYFLAGTVVASGSDYIITFYQNKHKLVYLIGNDYTMKGNAYTIKLPISEMKEVNELIMVAENLGAIPPNTSYMLAIVDEKRYDAYLSSSEGSSAMIRFTKKQ